MCIRDSPRQARAKRHMPETHAPIRLARQADRWRIIAPAARRIHQREDPPTTKLGQNPKGLPPTHPEPCWPHERLPR
eukprot:9456570-Alexandrium_andersonii.AAC.1